MFEDAVYAGVPNVTAANARPNLYYKCSRGSHSSDTSSAYSGSDTMASNHSEMDNQDDVDLTGLMESAVDSDEEDDLAESIDVRFFTSLSLAMVSVHVRDFNWEKN